MTVDQMLNLRDAAERLGCSTQTLRKISPSELPSYRVGPGNGCLRYKASELAAYIESRRVGEQPRVKPKRVLSGRPDGKPLRHV